MWRTILGVLGGIVTWALVASALDVGLRHGLPGYTRAEPVFAFTLAMKVARLSIAVLTSLAAGAVVHEIAPASKLAPWIAGIVLLALFLPVHIWIGARLPLWYHVFFLGTLAPLVTLGSKAAALLAGRQPGLSRQGGALR